MSFPEDNPSCFSIRQQKKVTCQVCTEQGGQVPKEFVENAFMLDIQEEYYSQKKSPNNFFQSETELRKCKICQQATPHRKDFTLSSFPEVLAIRISENENSFSQTTTHQTLTFKDLSKIDEICKILRVLEEQEQVYRFAGGVYNTNKGYDGVHSVAYIDDKTRGLLCYNDSWITSVKDSQIKGYAKLLFYVKEEVGLGIGKNES